ncbi:hypothetical protein TorRG33x02_176570 [Trema orientale]|uniref:Uncharacterized protein n=1 Tax=Trema orientale TaxID=63057 RepID=A0A2P5EM78_TREOI|nr:hypothetical protein TorRG33x02_176570 [Trema orientale]
MSSDCEPQNETGDKRCIGKGFGFYVGGLGDGIMTLGDIYETPERGRLRVWIASNSRSGELRFIGHRLSIYSCQFGYFGF